MLHLRKHINEMNSRETFLLFSSKLKEKVKVKSASVSYHQAGVYPGFCSVKRSGVFLLSIGWDAGPAQGYPQHRWYPFVHLGGERHCESKVSCLRTQCNVPS